MQIEKYKTGMGSFDFKFKAPLNAICMSSMHSAEESPAGIEEKAIKVLIVEDDPGDAKLVRLMLSESVHTYEAEVVGSIATTIKRMHDDAFYTVLLDMGLPDSHGTDTVLRVHSECPDIPVIVLTGLDDEEYSLCYRARTSRG